MISETVVTFRPLWQSPSDSCRVSELKSNRTTSRPGCLETNQKNLQQNDVNAAAFSTLESRLPRVITAPFSLLHGRFSSLRPFLSRCLFFGLINNAVRTSEADMSHANAMGFGCCRVAENAPAALPDVFW